MTKNGLLEIGTKKQSYVQQKSAVDSTTGRNRGALRCWVNTCLMLEWHCLHGVGSAIREFNLRRVTGWMQGHQSTLCLRITALECARICRAGLKYGPKSGRVWDWWSFNKLWWLVFHPVATDNPSTSYKWSTIKQAILSFSETWRILKSANQQASVLVKTVNNSYFYGNLRVSSSE